jgi:hypothetical protein
MGEPASGWPSRSKSGPFAVDFERRRFTDGSNLKRERVAPEDVYGTGSKPYAISLRHSARTGDGPVTVMPSAEAVSEPESVATIAPAAAPQRCLSDLGDA